jgi:CHAT domain-containing protein/Tfp pilus assembly protein PilF
MANTVAARLVLTSAVVCLLTCIVMATTNRAQSLKDADVRAQAVRILLDDGRYTEAEAEARRLLPPANEGAIGEADDLHTGDLLVEALVRSGRGAETRTRELAERILRARTARYGSTDASLAPSLRNLGDTLLGSGDYLAAVARYREGLAARERAMDARPSDIADDLDHLTQALTELEQYDEALAVSTRALGLRLETRDGTDIALARTLRLRGVVHQRKGQYTEARSALERALAFLEASNPMHPETVVALTDLGDQVTGDGDLVRAREILTRAVSLASRVLPSPHPDMASALGSLAANLQELGDLEESRVLRQRAVEIAEKLFGSDHPIVAVRLNDLANTSLLQGQYATAQQLYERARAIYYRRLGPDNLGVTTAAYNLALLYAHLGDFQEARRRLQMVIATWERVMGTGHPNVARAVSALANLLAKQGYDQEAQKHFERALAIRERILGPNHPYVAWTLGQRAESLARLAQVPRALALAARAVQICESSATQECLVGAQITFARILELKGNHAEAARAYERVLAIALPLLGPSHPEIAHTEVALAGVRARLHDRQNAFTGALRGDAIKRNHSRLTLAYLSERQALDYAASHERGLDLALSLMSGADEGAATFDALVLGRSLVLDELGARQRMRVTQKGALAPLWTELASARQRLANLVVRGPNDQRPEQYAALVDDARRAKEQAERQLAEQSATFSSELKKTEIDLRQVRAALPSDSALVSFVRFNRTIVGQASVAGAPPRSLSAPASRTIPSYVAFVLLPGSDAPVVVPLGRADALESLIAQWRRELIAGITQPTSTVPETERLFRARGINLRRRLWDPIAAHLDGMKRLYVVPDGAVNLVPLAALPVASSRYLLEAGPVIHYLSAERDLISPERPLAESTRGLLAIGGPAFADGSVFASLSKIKPTIRPNTQRPTEPPSPVLPPASSGASASFRSSGSKCRSFQWMRFPGLPGTHREAEEVADVWRGLKSSSTEAESAVQVLTGRDASERAVKQLGPGRRILHLATHGFFLGDQCASALDNTRAVGGLVGSARPKQAAPRRARSQELPENPLLLSGLAMAGANRRAAAGPDEDDGILTAEEVASLDLQGTEWAVLSACDTGLGEFKAGEGVLGLRRAFQIAGARTVIMSLWSVEDQATRVWMRALYDGRLNKRLNTADAVREASLSVLRARRSSGLSTHPFYWAAFVAAGDWH